MSLTNLQIDPDVPIPQGRTRYPFKDMEVGDSIFFDTLPKGTSARVSAAQFIQKHEPTWKFSLKQVSGGWRLWRTA